MPHLALMKPGRDQILVHLAARPLWFSRRCPRNMYIFGQVLWTAGRVVMMSSSRLPGRAPVERGRLGRPRIHRGQRNGDGENEAVYEIEQRLVGQPDPAIDTHFEYGSRAGWWRIMEVLERHGAKATVSACGQAVDRLPMLAADAVRRGHEVPAHGWRRESHHALDEATECERIALGRRGNPAGNRHSASRLAHSISGFVSHPAAVGRRRRLSLRQRRL